MEILNTLHLLGENLIDLGHQLVPHPVPALLLVAWAAWWLWAVNWHKAFRALVQGGWAPLVLLILVTALVWSCIAPSQLDLWGLAKVANFWWQLVAVALYVGLALFCGWLQLYFHWTPHEISLEPPAHGHESHGHGGHGHGQEAHGHGHDSHEHHSQGHSHGDAGHAHH